MAVNPARRRAESIGVIDVSHVDLDLQLAEVGGGSLAMDPGNRFMPRLDDCFHQIASEESRSSGHKHWAHKHTFGSSTVNGLSRLCGKVLELCRGCRYTPAVDQ